MQLVRNHDKLELYEEDIKLLEIMFIGAELVWIIYTNEPIVIPKDTDEYFYNNLNRIMENDYLFYNKLSSKSENEIIWFADKYCDLSNSKETDFVNRLIIKKENDNYIISVTNPYFEKNNITRVYNAVSFSPAGNGVWSLNKETNATFQDDMVTLYRNTLLKQKKKVKFKK